MIRWASIGAVAATSLVVACSVVSGLDDFQLAAAGGSGGVAATGGGGADGDGGRGGEACTNYVLAFDGVDDIVRVTAGTAYNPSSFTIEMWFALDGPTFVEEMRLVSYDQQSNSGFSLAFSDDSFTDAGRPWFRVHHNGGLDQRFADPLMDENWHHIAGIFDGINMRLYIDGQRAGMPTATSMDDFDGDFIIGSTSNGSSRFFRGAIDEVRMSRGSRYTGLTFVPEKRFTVDDDTLGLWHFDEGSGSMATDVGEGRDGQLQGSAGPSDGPEWVLDCF